MFVATFASILMAITLPAEAAHPLVKISDSTEHGATGRVEYLSFLCGDDDYSVTPGSTWRATSRGLCLVTEIGAEVNTPNGVVQAKPYTSSGTSYSQYNIVQNWNSFEVTRTVLVKGTEGECAEGSSTLGILAKVVSYNIYLIINAPSISDRISKIVDWFAQRDDDIVLLSEAWTDSDTIKQGMTAAGFCHYVYDDRWMLGSGLAVYSKFPIMAYDFKSFGSACKSSDCLADKGVAYAKVDRDGTFIHVFGSHTQADYNNIGEHADTRRTQYSVIKEFMEEKSIVEDDLVLIAGDLNEDKISTFSNYQSMLEDLDASDIPITGQSMYSYDGEDNTLIPGQDKQVLDYVLVSNDNAQMITGSACEYLKPVDSNNQDLSDHYPVACTIADSAAVCDVPIASWVGDGYCDIEGGYNVEACGWDGGDCCSETCTDSTFVCGVAGYDCKDPELL